MRVTNRNDHRSRGHAPPTRTARRTPALSQQSPVANALPTPTRLPPSLPPVSLPSSSSVPPPLPLTSHPLGYSFQTLPIDLPSLPLTLLTPSVFLPDSSSGSPSSSTDLGLYKILFHFQSFSGSPSSFYCPRPTCKAVLQYQCTPIVQSTPPHRPPCLCHTPYNIGDSNIA